MTHEAISAGANLPVVDFNARKIVKHLRNIAPRTPVTEVMTQDVVCLWPHMDLMRDARNLLLKASVWVAPVVDDESKVLGSVCLTDVMRSPSDFSDGGIPLSAFTSEGYHYLVGPGFQFADLPKLLVEHVMAPIVKTLSTQTTIAEAVARFRYGTVSFMFVTTDDLELRGIVTWGDLYRWMSPLAQNETSTWSRYDRE